MPEKTTCNTQLQNNRRKPEAQNRSGRRQMAPLGHKPEGRSSPIWALAYLSIKHFPEVLRTPETGADYSPALKRGILGKREATPKERDYKCQTLTHCVLFCRRCRRCFGLVLIRWNNLCGRVEPLSLCSSPYFPFAFLSATLPTTAPATAAAQPSPPKPTTAAVQQQ